MPLSFYRHFPAILASAAFSIVPLLSIDAQLPGQSPEQAAYKSPYTFAASVSDPMLTPDFREGAHALSNWQNWSSTPYASWNNFQVVQALNSTWGPRYISFTAPVGADKQSLDWFQKRLVAAASVMRNEVPYAHHHMAQWNVPDTLQWRAAGFTPGYGFDCSDFARFIYSYGLGISLNSAVGKQSSLTQAAFYLSVGTKLNIAAHKLFDVQNGYSKDYATLVRQLEPGDLLYIRGNPALQNPITHVIMWLGGLASDTKGLDPNLVTDCHGASVHDSNGNLIPTGPEIRPFRTNGYYYHCFDHVIRYLPFSVVP